MNEELKEFIDRCYSEEFQGYVKKTIKQGHWERNKWHRDNPEKCRESVRKYSLSEKGEIARRKCIKNRYRNFKKACEGLSDEENEQIRLFYENCPVGYVVDHIIPICEGGLHRLNNLQYLTPLENLKKGRKLNWKMQTSD